MPLLRRLLERLGLARKPEKQRYFLDASLQPLLSQLAEQQQRSPDELASSLVTFALAQQVSRAELWQKWEALSPRQQQVAALICRGYTNPQIAARLKITVATVHTHSGNIQNIFEVNSKSALRILLAEWDFTAWDT